MEELLSAEKSELLVFSQGSAVTSYTRTDEIDQEMIDIIETKEFSRLKEISQLGSYRFYQKHATHTRFEHCIGTMAFADRILEGTKKNSFKLNEDRNNILAAALCHDLGHGPFSHTFDNNFIQVRFPHLNWTHEDCSTMLLEYLIDQNSLDHFDKYDIRIIQNFIVGKNHPIKNEGGELISEQFPMQTKGWMFDIVNNKRNSLDIDKFDYLKRDTQTLGLTGYDFDSELLLNGAKVIDNQICYPLSAVNAVKDLYEARYAMFRDVYCSPISKAIDLQICDIFNESNDYYRYDEAIQDFELYCNLTDDILYNIIENDDSSLDYARSLTNRLLEGDFYTPVLEIQFDPKLYQTYKEITPEQIVCYSNISLDPSKIKVDISKINYSMGNSNPLKTVKFYEESSNTSCNLEDPDKLIPRYKIETYFNVYCTDSSLADEVKKAACNALKKMAGCSPTKSMFLHGF